LLGEPVPNVLESGAICVFAVPLSLQPVTKYDDHLGLGDQWRLVAMASRRPRRRSSSAVAIRTPDDPISLFISYRRADSAGHVGRLHDHLREIPAFRAGGIFLDTDSIKGGADFVKAMDCAVRFADVMLVVIGRDWVSIRARGQRRIDHPEDPVRREIRNACKENVPIVPVLVRGATMPSAEDLPSAIVRLTKRNAIEVSDTRFTHDVERLVYAIQNAAVTSTRKRPRPPRRLDAARSLRWASAP